MRLDPTQALRTFTSSNHRSRDGCVLHGQVGKVGPDPLSPTALCSSKLGGSSLACLGSPHRGLLGLGPLASLCYLSSRHSIKCSRTIGMMGPASGRITIILLLPARTTTTSSSSSSLSKGTSRAQVKALGSSRSGVSSISTSRRGSSSWLSVPPPLARRYQDLPLPPPPLPHA